MTPYPHIVGKIEYTKSIYKLFCGGWQGSFRKLEQTNMYHINVYMPINKLIDCKHYNLVVTDHNGTRSYINSLIPTGKPVGLQKCNPK